VAQIGQFIAAKESIEFPESVLVCCWHETVYLASPDRVVLFGIHCRDQPVRRRRLVVAPSDGRANGRGVYAVRKGKDLTVDVLRPRGAKGRGVITLVSGGWKSRRDSLQDIIVAPLLRRGYTIFILV
jgi:hypothetical protein